MANAQDPPSFKIYIFHAVGMLGYWGLPCKQIEPVLEQLSEKYRGKCKVLKVNIDKNRNIAKKLQY